ncbi:MAG TPA: Rieske (2Fe-2S) protein [Vicinamibacterales bacterium]
MNDDTVCQGCDGPRVDAERREFLRAAGCFATALTVLGLTGADLSALDVSFATGVQAGNERVYPMPAADGVTIDRDAQVIIARANGKVAAMALSCPHQNAAVKWLPNDHRFQCTRHDSQYTPEGVYTSGRATRNMDRFPIRRDGSNLRVDITKVFHSDQDAAGWAAASVPV